jgi:transposase
MRVRSHRILRLSEEERRALEHAAAALEDARQHRRIVALLMLAEGRSPSEVAATRKVNVCTVIRWRNRYEAQRRADALRDRPRSGRPARTMSVLAPLVFEIVRTRPPFAIPRRKRWSAALVQRVLEARYGLKVGKSTVERALRGIGPADGAPSHPVTAGSLGPMPGSAPPGAD